MALGVAPVRRLLGRILSRARIRRRWHRGVRTARIPAFEHQLPAVIGIDRLPAGERLDLRVPVGSCVADLESAAEVIAASLGVREVRVRRDPANASRADVVIVRRDPLAATGPLAWPSLPAERLSLWEPIPIGVGEDGRTVAFTLPERNVLLGGEPGAGKSVALSLPVATAALDPAVKLWLLDGKLVELATWAGCAEHSVGISVAEAIDVLRQLRTEMELRYAELLAGRKRKVGPDDDMALHVVVCDELAHYLTGSERREREEFTSVLRDLVSRGRAAGVIVLAATGTGRPCIHGRTRGCGAIHESDDEQLGEPLCPDCFDYRRAVIWNALATELWRRTTIATTRALAAQAGLTVTALSRLARLSYVKVVEYQRRGVIHLHVVARLDGPTGPETPPPIPTVFLERALRQAATAARVPYPPGSGLPGAARWGAEIDVRPVASDGLQAKAVAAYIAKYATKSTDAIGRLDHKLKPSDLDALDLRPHLAWFVTTAWNLGGRPELAHLRLRDWAQTLGFRGHWLTKSRRYSTTCWTARSGASTT